MSTSPGRRRPEGERRSPASGLLVLLAVGVLLALLIYAGVSALLDVVRELLG